MANRYYVSGEQRAGKVKELFTAIAHRYDLINDLQSLGFHRRWKRQLVRLAELSPGERALDLCCGTGDVALGLVKTGGAVVGLDFSLAMLVLGRARARRLAVNFPSAPITFLRGDALRVPFRNAAFDVVTISYGLRNLANLEGGLTEIWRILKPRGRLLVLDFGKPENPLGRRFYFGYLRCCVPWLGRLFCGDREAYAYILESLVHYPAQRGVADLMERMNFRNVRVVDLLGGIMSINSGTK